MQHTLLGLAIAFILAIAAALAAPAFVDWGSWRASFETRASALAGAPVRIRGGIEASLLPTPAFTFRDVDIGEPEKGTGARIAEVRGVLSLGSLLRGTVEAEQFVLVRPAMRLKADAAKAPLPRTAQTVAAATGLVALARFSIERGSIVFDRDGHETVFDDIYAEGEMRSRQGPMRLDGVFRRDGRRWGIRANAGQFSNGAGRVRLTLDHAGAGRTFDADGSLSLAGASPRFEGKVTASYVPPAGIRGGQQWQVAAGTKADENAVTLDGIQLTLGKEAAPSDIGGSIRFQPWSGGSIEGNLKTVRIDLDVAAGGEAARSLAAALTPLRDLYGFLDTVPLRGRVGVTLDAMTAAGGTMREIKADLGFRETHVAIERFEAALPGRAFAVASGGQTGDARFSGRMSLQAEDAGAFVRWVHGGTPEPFRDAGTMRLAGRVDWNRTRMQMNDLEFSLGNSVLGGSLAVEPGTGEKRTQVAARLTADGSDLDLLRPIADWLRGETSHADVLLTFRGKSLRVLGRPLEQIDAALVRSQEGVAVEKLTLINFDGLSVRATGRIAAPVERPSGTIDFDLSTARPDGLAAIAREFLGEEAGQLVRHAAGSGSPLKLAGKATGAGSAAGVEVNASGTLGDLDASLAVSFDLLTEQLSEGRMVLEAREPKSLAVLLGFSPGLPTAGSASLEFDLSRPEKGALPLNARLSVPGADISAEGELQQTADGRIDPRLKIKVAARDLRYLFHAAALTAGERGMSADGGFTVSRTGNGFLLRDIVMKVDGTDVRGELTASAPVKPVLGGKLSIGEMRATSLLAAAFGGARDGASFWPARRLGPVPLGDATGAVELEVAALELPGGLFAKDAKLRLRLGAGQAAIEDLSAEVAGGRLEAQLGLVRGETLAVNGRASLQGFDVARAIVPHRSQSELRGRGNLTLSLAGSGATPAAIAASLAGQGTLAIENLEIDRADPGAVRQVFASDEKSEPRDEISAIALLSPALAAGPLKIARIEAPIVVAAGNARTVRARANAGDVQIGAEASLDLAKLLLDAAVEMEIDAPENLAVRPGAVVRWRGPLANIERGVEAAALVNAINLRAMERETNRIERRDRGLAPQQRSDPASTPDTNPIAAVPPGAQKPAPAPTFPQIPVPQARPRSIDTQPPRTALPPLPPPAEIRPLPPVYRDIN